MKLKKKTLSVLSIALMVTVALTIPLAEAPVRRFYLVRVFPTPDDSWNIASDPWMWHAGDYVYGTRDLGMRCYIKRILVHLELSENVLSGDGVVILEIHLNGIKVGQFRIYPGDTSIDLSKGPFTIWCSTGWVSIRFLEQNTVLPGKGSIQIDPVYSCVGFKVQV